MAWVTFTATELNIDKPAKSSTMIKFKDRDDHLKSAISDGLGAAQDLDVNNIYVRGTAFIDGAEFPERALIFMGF